MVLGLDQTLVFLIDKGAIEEVMGFQASEGLFSQMFLVDKKDGGVRPILDLRKLNVFLHISRFRMAVHSFNVTTIKS